MDVVFVLDLSPNVRDQCDYAVMFVGNVTHGLDIDSGNVRVAVVAPLGQFYLRDYVNRREAVLAALRLLNSGGGTANTMCPCALDQVRNTHFSPSYGARDGARKVIATFGFCFSCSVARFLCDI